MRYPAVSTLALALLGASCLSPAWADSLLAGRITAAAGEKLGGVTVSAKAEGQTITTSVFTDDAGAYYFPPLPPGKYRVWAQALSFGTAKGEVDLSADRKQDFVLAPMKDYVRQLPGDVLIAALPEATPDDKRLKRLVRNDCTGCHTPSYTLQHTFDEAGWNAIIELMKHVNVSGIYQGPDSKPNGILDFHQKELAAYLARARGPGESAMNIKLPPRPSGEAARAVFREYDVARDDESVTAIAGTDGSDWSLGTPSRLGSLPHDAWADTDGNLWFTSNVPNHKVTVGRIDATTGKVEFLKVAGARFAANSHGMTRDPDGIIWFNLNTGRGSLGRLDPKTRKIDVYTPPEPMSPTGGATTVDYDGQGKIWVSSPDGALRFDPKTETFTEFKSATFKTPNGTGITYGAAADRDGNGWWAEMTIDTIGRSDVASGKSHEIKLPPISGEMEIVTPEERKFYASFVAPDFNTPFPWSQGPRRMGTDKNADVLWIGNSWGGSLTRIDTKTLATTFVPLPDPVADQPYHAAVDSRHNVWLNLWTTDKIMRYDPASNAFTSFELPTRGTESRYISVLERDGAISVVMPYSRTSKVAVMTLRSEADLAALRSRAGAQ